MNIKKEQKKLIFDILYIIFTVAIILLGYQIIACIINEEFTLPKLNLISKEVIFLFSKSFFWRAFFKSLLRTVIGFALSFILALTLSLIHKYVLFLRKFISIIISILRAVPTIAIILNLLFWTNSSVAPIIIACLVTLPQLYSSILDQINGFDGKIVEMCQLYNVPQNKIFFKVYIPYVMPRLALSLCSNFALTLKLIGSSEALCSTMNSIGYLMKDAKASYNPSQLIALSMICIVVAVILEYVLSFTIRKIWRIK